ncbi:piggyBac transposable element-derived protein 4 [Trichonephila clavata]|uniref:PiggyBac transposable element-derived protein 4 n=1 Tax=Trichonephila clavata TaxID=2740835 RepID=A0A8X6GBT0_TRICU|nr:piggyBac transposable element-derived protein 4 [Trichonephila clavata]
MTVPAESSPSLFFNLNHPATELDVFLKIFPKCLMIWIFQCTNHRDSRTNNYIYNPSEIMLVMSHNKVPKFSHYWSSNPSLGNVEIKKCYFKRQMYNVVFSKQCFAEPENVIVRFHCTSCRSFDVVQKAQRTVSTPYRN